MVDVSLRDKRKANGSPAVPPLRPRVRTPRVLLRPGVIAAATIAVAVALAVGLRSALDAWNDNVILSGRSADTTPVALSIASEALSIPANMIRSGKGRRGGAVERIDLAVHWPTLEGYSEALADAFGDGAATAPIIYLTIMPREMPVDSTGRLESVYARFFVGKAEPGPNGLVGRQLAEDSGYGGEVVYFAPAEARPFVARCLVETAPDVPATCLRDLNIGRGLSLHYRFNIRLLDDWAALDASMHKLATGFLAP